ncbi:hypothetical protein M0E87_02550 [Corynebacterium sp. CCM 9185]|uniref:Uncharacterized protein n=1 Tax=Corynebacterium marambiense TaxID=2765364 RepID=A0ABS0VVR1_9CORY|nr:hypothetical protein [Corynebacterium marambiense]MBI8999705.1 hypothetical protein [Corynebacterium marambiense]MCK7662545.1 hypothetical protein [Corynebacterium marambiense]
MQQYRLKPQFRPAHVAQLIGVLMLVVSVPLLIMDQLPGSGRPVGEVILGDSVGGGWQIPLRYAGGEPVICDKLQDVVMEGGWDCGGTQIKSLVVKDVPDPELAARRMMRAMGIFEAKKLEVMRDGDLLELHHPEEDGPRMVMFSGEEPEEQFTGLALPGTGDHEGELLVVAVFGERGDDYTGLISPQVRNNGERDVTQLELPSALTSEARV